MTCAEPISSSASPDSGNANHGGAISRAVGGSVEGVRGGRGPEAVRGKHFGGESARGSEVFDDGDRARKGQRGVVAELTARARRGVVRVADDGDGNFTGVRLELTAQRGEFVSRFHAEGGSAPLEKTVLEREHQRVAVGALRDAADFKSQILRRVRRRDVTPRVRGRRPQRLDRLAARSELLLLSLKQQPRGIGVETIGAPRSRQRQQGKTDDHEHEAAVVEVRAQVESAAAAPLYLRAQVQPSASFDAVGGERENLLPVADGLLVMSALRRHYEQAVGHWQE